MDMISRTVTLLLTILFEVVISWKIAHAIEKWKNANKKENLQSKLVVSIIMVSLIFMFLISTIIIHALITNEPIEIYLIYIALILLVGYILTIFILFKCFSIAHKKAR